MYLFTKGDLIYIDIKNEYQMLVIAGENVEKGYKGFQIVTLLMKPKGLKAAVEKRRNPWAVPDGNTQTNGGNPFIIRAANVSDVQGLLRQLNKAKFTVTGFVNECAGMIELSEEAYNIIDRASESL